jgi:pimeloyl-ACP methyl ester carboxylesterase
MIAPTREHLGWVLHESGPESADHTVLLLPGALCTAAFYGDLLAEPSMSKASIRFVATTVPGFGGTAPPEDMSMESYSKLAGQLVSDLGCDAVVGHSLGANIALEVASAGEFSGPLVLLSPSFSRRDESRFPRALDRLSRVLGHLPYSLMLKIIGPAMKSSLPPTRREALIAELKKNDPHFLRRQTHLYLEYLDRHGSLAPRFADSGVPAWVVFGESDDIGLTDDERAVLEASPHVSIVRISDAGHFTLNQQPEQIAKLVLGAVTSRAPRQPANEPTNLGRRSAGARPPLHGTGHPSGR